MEYLVGVFGLFAAVDDPMTLPLIAGILLVLALGTRP